MATKTRNPFALTALGLACALPLATAAQSTPPKQEEKETTLAERDQRVDAAHRREHDQEAASRRPSAKARRGVRQLRSRLVGTGTVNHTAYQSDRRLLSIEAPNCFEKNQDQYDDHVTLQRDFRDAPAMPSRRVNVRMNRDELRRRYSSMGGPTKPDPNGSTTVDTSSRDKPTSLG